MRTFMNRYKRECGVGNVRNMKIITDFSAMSNNSSFLTMQISTLEKDTQLLRALPEW